MTCFVCGLDERFECFDDCLKCTAAFIVANPAPWASNRKFYLSTPWVAVLEREVERQRLAFGVAA